MEVLTVLTVVGLLVLGRPVRPRRPRLDEGAQRHPPARSRLRCAHRW